jgi:MFS family permease
MALLVRIYFNGVFGALGGLLGWMLFGVFGSGFSDPSQWLQRSVVGGALIGGSIGYFVVSVEALRDLSLARFCRLASYGVALGAVGGAAGMCVAELVNMGVIRLIGTPPDKGVSARHLLLFALGRGLGWMFLGVAIGVSEGIAARSLGKLSYGTLGGAIGGFVGGALFGLFYYLLVIRGERSEHGGLSYLWAALGLVILGACIGSLSAFVQGVLQPASVKVMRGWQEGREYPLLKADTLLGREEHADIALFRDMKVEKRHAVIKRQGNRFLLINNHAPPQQTRVNDELVPQTRELRDGDRIQLGNIVLRFQMREAQNRRRVASG